MSDPRGGLNDIETGVFDAPRMGGMLPDGRIQDWATLSIAISLKRIADVLAPGDRQDVGSSLFYIEESLRELRR